MCLLFESIKVINRRFQHPGYHQERINRSRRDLLGYNTALDLYSVEIPTSLSSGLYKCRFEYGKDPGKTTFTPYKKKIIKRLKLVEDNLIDYRFKYCDRSAINALVRKYAGEDEDIIIVKNGLITDSSYSNLAFLRNSGWVTPAEPLLNGTCRQRLLQEGILQAEEIRPSDLSSFSNISLINAMLDIGDLILPVSVTFAK